MKARRTYCLRSPGRLSESELCACRRALLQRAGVWALWAPPRPASHLAAHVKTDGTDLFYTHNTASCGKYDMGVEQVCAISLLSLASVFSFVNGEKARLVKFLPVLKEYFDIFNFCRMSLSCLHIKHSFDEIFFSPPKTCLRNRNKCFCDCFLWIPTRLNITSGATRSGDLDTLQSLLGLF